MADRIELALVFGSLAAGRQQSGSDVDLFIIGGVSLLEVVTALSDAQSQLGREINPVIMTADDFVAQKEKEDRFIARVLDEPKILVIGKADDLAKLAEHRAAG